MSVVRYRSEEPVGSLRFHFVTTVIGDDNVQHRTWTYTLSPIVLPAVAVGQITNLETRSWNISGGTRV